MYSHEHGVYQMRKSLFQSMAVFGLMLTTAVAPAMAGSYEEPKYTVVETSKPDIEIRDYAPTIVAETVTTGDRDTAIKAGFRLIADYIFGNNTSSKDIAMTAPVQQQANEKIAMTIPVLQQGDTAQNSWTTRFVMPSQYTMETLPKPNKPEVTLREQPAVRMVAIRFSGTHGEDNLSEHLRILDKFISQRGLKTISTPQYAFYNPPWTLWFLRRNEIMYQVAAE